MSSYRLLKPVCKTWDRTPPIAALEEKKRKRRRKRNVGSRSAQARKPFHDSVPFSWVPLPPWQSLALALGASSGGGVCSFSGATRRMQCGGLRQQKTCTCSSVFLPPASHCDKSVILGHTPFTLFLLPPRRKKAQTGTTAMHRLFFTFLLSFSFHPVKTPFISFCRRCLETYTLCTVSVPVSPCCSDSSNHQRSICKPGKRGRVL